MISSCLYLCITRNGVKERESMNPCGHSYFYESEWTTKQKCSFELLHCRLLYLLRPCPSVWGGPATVGEAELGNNPIPWFTLTSVILQTFVLHLKCLTNIKSFNIVLACIPNQDCSRSFLTEIKDETATLSHSYWGFLTIPVPTQK